MGAEFKKVHIIINPASGRNEPILNPINDVFAEAGIEWDVSITHKFGDARQFAEDLAKRDDLDLVIAYGGDGTVMEVVNGIWKSGKPLALLCGGTGNAVAREFGVDTRLDRALRQIASGKGGMRQIDLGCVDDGVFLLRSDVGVSEVLDKAANREAKDRYGVLAYLIGIMKAFPEAQTTHYQITIDGQEIEYTGSACIVVNMGSIGTFDIPFGDQVRYDDGMLNLFLAKNNLSTALEVAASVAHLNTLDNALNHYMGKDITINTDPIRNYSADGERMGKTPYHVTIQAGALNLFVPEVDQEQFEGSSQ